MGGAQSVMGLEKVVGYNRFRVDTTRFCVFYGIGSPLLFISE